MYNQLFFIFIFGCELLYILSSSVLVHSKCKQSCSIVIFSLCKLAVLVWPIVHSLRTKPSERVWFGDYIVHA